MPCDLLLELGCEDLPARYVMPLAEALRAGVTGGLARRGVAHGSAQLFATPRRIAVLVAGVAAEQPTQSIDLTGPAVNVALKDGAPTPAALGFAKKCGVEFAALGQKDGKLHYARSEPGKATSALIPEIFEETLKAMDELVPKRMRWGSGSETFVRPVSWITCLLGSDVVPLSRFDVQSGRLTYGHRFHAPAAISLAAPADYEAALKAAKVWAEVESRKAEVRRQIEVKAAALGGYARITEDLLDEVTALVEWPVVIAGQMEQRFTDELPREVIVATVETNQRYFTVFADAAMTKITPHFITIANVESKDPAQVVEGNERVVRPRLTDALFFWEQDLKLWKRDAGSGYLTLGKLLVNTPWGQQARATTYVKGLGTYDQRLSRVQLIGTAICEALNLSDQDMQIAAVYAKLDLFSKMVFEFPELQGIMGSYYASVCGVSTDIASAIRDQYLPNSPSSRIPATLSGCVLALADKIDALAGLFGIDQKPTASKDPFALRRAAIGILRICIERPLPLDLRPILWRAFEVQPKGFADESVHSELLQFISDRLRAMLVGNTRNGISVSVEAFEAVHALGIAVPTDFVSRLDALLAFTQLDSAKNLAAAHKRVRNILKQAGGASGAVSAEHFEHDSERALFAAMQKVQAANAAQPDYTQKLLALASLREPIYAFMDARTATGEPLKVMADNPAVRANRLALLAQLDGMCREVADISLLPGV